MKKSTTIFALFLFMLFVLAGCGGTETETPVGEVTPSGNPAESEKAPPEEMTVSVVNSTGYAITELYISPITDSDWSENLLGPDGIENGGQGDVALMAPSSQKFIMKVVDEEGDACVFRNVSLANECEVEFAWDSGEAGATVTYASGGTEYTKGSLQEGGASNDTPDDQDPADPSVQLEVSIYNGVIWHFAEIYAYKAGAFDMGENLAINGTLIYEESTTITVGQCSSYDIMLVDESGTNWEFKNVKLEDGCEIEVIKQTDAEMHITYSGGTTEVYTGNIY